LKVFLRQALQGLGKRVTFDSPKDIKTSKHRKYIFLGINNSGFLYLTLEGASSSHASRSGEQVTFDRPQDIETSKNLRKYLLL
jgi:hypothetical protein